MTSAGSTIAPGQNTLTHLLAKRIGCLGFCHLPGHCSSFTGAYTCHNISCHIGHHDPRDVICTGSFRTFTTDDYQGLTWMSWIFLCLGREASLSSYRPVIVHAWFLATDRALGALVRLSRIRRTGQPKQGSGRVLFFFLLFVLRVLGRRVLSSSYSAWELVP